MRSPLVLVHLDRMGCGASTPTAPGVTSTAAGRAASSAAGASCFIGPEFAPLKLANVVDYNHDTKIFEFGLPEGQSLNLPVCACILLKGKSADGEDAVRPYTPISTNSMLGRFQLLIKTYEQGVVSKYVHGLSIGDEVDFKHIPFNVKIQHPFQAQVEGGGPVRTVSMLCGGTGIVRLPRLASNTRNHRIVRPTSQLLMHLITDAYQTAYQSTLCAKSSSASRILLMSKHWFRTPCAYVQAPMYQALHRVLNDPADSTEVTLVYGSKTEPDILLRAELDELATKHPAQLKLHYVLSDETPEGWAGEVGHVDQEKIERLCPGPKADTLVFVCGVPPMYEALCGPRGEAELPDGTVLKELGYTKEMVYKF